MIGLQCIGKLDLSVRNRIGQPQPDGIITGSIIAAVYGNGDGCFRTGQPVSGIRVQWKRLIFAGLRMEENQLRR